MIAVAQDVMGQKRVRPVVDSYHIDFPVLVDKASELGRVLGFRVVPAGFFVDANGIVAYEQSGDFDIGDPRVRLRLEKFLAGERLEVAPQQEMAPEALELFAQGAAKYADHRTDEALELWRTALEIDPDNLIIRSQIWTVEHPERFWPVVDKEWQKNQV